MNINELSPYLANQLERYPELHQEALPPNLDEISSEEELLQKLRFYKHYCQVKLIQDWLKKSLKTEEFLEKCSDLAQKLIETALQWQFNNLQKRFGETNLEFSVLAMGKLGGRELNFSSDVDLIFVYRKNGTLEKNNKIIELSQFYLKLAQKLISSLNDTTPQGQVYRVDMRLRPFGQSGPLVLSHEAMEQYYTIHGRDWERYALMKARIIAGDIQGGEQLLQRLRPFIYRRYLDYRAIKSISEMKAAINQHYEQELANDIKLGFGGIREAEFTVQAMQIIYGGQYPSLQTSSYLSALKALQQLNLWSKHDVETLKMAYLFLRNVENALQFENEAQIHHINDNPQAWKRLATACHYDDVNIFRHDLHNAQELIHQRFNKSFANNADNQEALNHHQVQENRETPEIIKQFIADFPWQRLPKDSVRHLEFILQNLVELNPETSALNAVLELLERIARRSSYLYLLSAEKPLIEKLLVIAEKSQWLMGFIIEHPVVLDDILMERGLPSLEALENDLQARLRGIEDDEAFAHALRDFKNTQIFKTAWQDVKGALPLMQVSDRLTYLAELIVRCISQRVQKIMAQKHGYVFDKEGKIAELGIIAYGKLGGLELSYGSDLDLVFIYSADDNENSDGEKALPNPVYFTRWAQRIINILSVSSIDGVLYSCDMRLRPNGQSGLLVNNFESYAQYLHEQAQTWEYQALARARIINGDEILQKRFEDLRAEILSLPRDNQTLKEEVLTMREKMRLHKKTSNKLSIKHDFGGLVDIEFIVQYLLLKYAHQEPILHRMSDNIRQLAALEASGILVSNDAMILRDTYRKLRLEYHHNYLNKNSEINLDEWKISSENVQKIWQKIFTAD